MSINVEKQDKKEVSPDKEVEVGDALTLIIKGLRKIGRLIAWCGEVFISGLVFIKRRLWWLLLAVAIGLGCGICQNMAGGPKYSAEMTARFNYESPVVLYGTIDYLNGLISDARHDTLAALFSISREEASSILSFSAIPVEDPFTISDLYRQHYMEYNRTMLVRQDTLWPRILPFNDFKKGINKDLTKYIMPVQQITVFASRPNLFSQLQKGLIDMISSNAVVQKDKEVKNKWQVEEENLILSALKGLDTLRTVYNERIRTMSKRQENSSTNISLLDQSLNAPSPELSLYDKELLFRDELRKIRQDEMNNQNIVQVYVPFNQYGKRTHSFIKSCVIYAVKALLIMFLILLCIELYRFVDRREKEQRRSSLINN